MRQWFILFFILVLLFCLGEIMGWGLVHDAGKELFEILPIFTPLLIGAGIVYIAWQQWQTNQNRLRVELFDRRYKTLPIVKTIFSFV